MTPRHRDERKIVISPTRSVGTCTSATLCTTTVLPRSAVTVMRASSSGEVPAVMEKRVGSVTPPGTGCCS
jgi:hypothetical protein